MRNFDKGDRVLARGQPGTVRYRRMAPPSFAQAAAYCVVLDEKAADPEYSGTIFNAADVQPLGEVDAAGS